MSHLLRWWRRICSGGLERGGTLRGSQLFFSEISLLRFFSHVVILEIESIRSDGRFLRSHCQFIVRIRKISVRPSTGAKNVNNQVN